MNREYYLPPVRRSKVSRMEEIRRSENVAASIYEAAFDQEDRERKFDDFKRNVKTYFLKEAMSKVLLGSLPSDIDESYVIMGKTLVENFINEEGVDTLLKRFSTTSVFLAEMGSIVEESYKSVVEGCDVSDPDTYLIKSSDDDKFYDKLGNMNTETMSKTIAAKVADAEREFIQSNVQDRETMETLAQETKDKIDSYIHKDASVTESVRLGYEQEYKEKVANISNRPKGILEAMVLKASNNIVADENLRSIYVNESGKLNTNKIIDTCEIMYTLLEMVNTAKMRTVDEEYIKNVIDSLS